MAIGYLILTPNLVVKKSNFCKELARNECRTEYVTHFTFQVGNLRVLFAKADGASRINVEVQRWPSM
jgi:hypothetical protein